MVTTGLDDIEVQSYVETLKEKIYSPEPFFSHSMKVKKFIYDLMKNYLDEKEKKSEDELSTLKSFQDQLEKMIDYFYKEKGTKFLAASLDTLKCIIAEKVGSLEGWYTGECEF